MAPVGILAHEDNASQPESPLLSSHEAPAAELVDVWRACNGQQAVDGPALLASAARAGLVPCPYTGACFTRRVGFQSQHTADEVAWQ